MKSFEQLAQAAFEAHHGDWVERTGGAPLPWASLSPTTQARWVKAAQAVVAEMASIQ